MLMSELINRRKFQAINTLQKVSKIEPKLQECKATPARSPLLGSKNVQS